MQETPQGNWLGRIINKIVGSSEQTLPVDKRAAISHNVDTAWRKAAPPLFKADNLGELLAASPILFVPTAALVRPEEIKTDNLNKAIKFDSNLGNGPLENLPVNPEQPVNPEPTPIGTAVATEVAQLYSGPGQSYNVEGQTQINQQLTYVGRANINGEAWALTDQGQWARVDSLNLNQQELENVTDLSVFNSTPEVDLAGDGSGYENLSGSLFDQDIDLVHVKHQLDGMVESGFPQELLNHLGLLDASDQSTALVIKEDFSVTSGETTITYERGTLIDIPNNPNETTITFVSPANIRSALSEQYGFDLGQDQLLFSKSSSEDPSWRQIVKLNSNMVMLFDVGGSREDNAAGKPINEILANNVIVINGDFASEDFTINYDNNTITLADGTVLTITQNEGEVARAEVTQGPDQNTINLENYNGRPWTGDYAVRLNSNIQVNADEHVLNGAIIVDGASYPIMSRGAHDGINKDRGTGGNYDNISLFGVFAGFVGERTLQDVNLTNPDTGETVLHYDTIDVIDLMMIVTTPDNHQIRVIFSVPSNNIAADAYGGRGDSLQTRESFISMLTPGQKVSPFISVPTVSWADFIRPILPRIGSAPAETRQYPALNILNQQYYSTLNLLFQGPLNNGTYYMGYPANVAIVPAS